MSSLFGSNSLPQRFTAENALILLVDHQKGTVDWVKSTPKETVIASCRVLTKLATTFNIPLVLTTTMEQYVGTTIPEITELCPEQYKVRYQRGGELSCWDDKNLVDGVKKIGRKNIILAGLTTDICLIWAAHDAVKHGYHVMVVADACGSMTTLADQLTWERLRSWGVVVTVINSVVTELFNNFGTEDGKKAQQILSDEIVSKLK